MEASSIGEFFFKGIPYFALVAVAYVVKVLIKQILSDPKILKRIRPVLIVNWACTGMMVVCILILGFDFRTSAPASIGIVGYAASIALMGSLCATLVTMNNLEGTQKRVAALEKAIHQALQNSVPKQLP